MEAAVMERKSMSQVEKDKARLEVFSHSVIEVLAQYDAQRARESKAILDAITNK